MDARGGESPSSLMGRLRSRRQFILSGAAAAAALAAGSAILAACGGGAAAPGSAPASAAASSASAAPSSAAPASAAAGGVVTFGSNYSDAVPRKAMQNVFDGFTKKTGIKVKVNTVDHTTFQNQINSYLQGQPDDVFTWFAGYRMQFFAAQHLSTPINDLWAKFGSNFSPAMKAASTGADGNQYFVPFYNYPWAVFYRKSLFAAKGYQPPKTLDQFKALAGRMQKDGLVPLAFADKQGWPAMGTFDILNMRTNGYAFHISLMAGKESWTDPKVKAVFETWKSLLPYQQSAALGRKWQAAAQGVVGKKTGMYYLGMFVSQQFTKPADLADLDFFAFPEVVPAHGQSSIDAPIDGFMLSKAPKNLEGAKALMEFLASGEAENLYLATDPSNIGVAKDVKTSTYTPLQHKGAELISSAKHIAQYMDRDTRPDFASTVMIPSLQKFLNQPSNIGPLLTSIEQQKKSIFK
ncbi:MAG: ABC transporter substrate-binding protein [Chloroflexota bacterium]